MAIYVYFMLILNFVVLGILVVLYCLIYYRLYQNRKKMLNAVQPISVLRNQPSNTEPSHSKSGESTETGTHNNPQSSSMETCKDKNKMPKPTYHENERDKKSGLDINACPIVRYQRKKNSDKSMLLVTCPTGQVLFYLKKSLNY